MQAKQGRLCDGFMYDDTSFTCSGILRPLRPCKCGKLEIIQEYAFTHCESLRSIDLPSVKVVKEEAFEF